MRISYCYSVLCFLFIYYTPNYSIAQTINDTLCYSANSFIHVNNMLSINGEATGVWKNDSKYIESGTIATLEAKQRKTTTVTSSFPFVEIVTRRDFFYFRVDPYLSLSSLSARTADENLTLAFATRGSLKFMVVALDDDVVQPGGPFGPDFIPLCEIIDVYVHSKPTVSYDSLSVSNSIYAKLGVSIDSLSKNARELNWLISVRWKFINETSGDVEIVNTNTNFVNYSPRYNGFYRLEAQVSDGTLFTSYTFFVGPYSGGVEPEGPTFELQ